jgi:periodic tryptophan protein 2
MQLYLSLSSSPYSLPWLSLMAGSKYEATSAPSKWRLSHKHYLNSPTHLGRAVGMYVAPAIHLAVIALDTGAIALYDLWTQQQLQSLTISTAAISVVVLSPDATWIGIAAAETGSLAVWEWQSETYILRQQGLSLSMRCVAADQSRASCFGFIETSSR